MFAVRSTSPFVPKVGIGLPVDASRAINRHRLAMRIRRCLPSLHVATPRCTNPVPFEGWPASYACGSYDHSSRPLAASRATTRLNGVLRNSVSPMASGVTWNCPGRAGIEAPGGVIGCSAVFHVHATVNRETLERSMVVRAEYLSPPASPPYTGHSLGFRAPSADRSGE